MDFHATVVVCDAPSCSMPGDAVQEIKCLFQAWPGLRRGMILNKVCSRCKPLNGTVRINYGRSPTFPVFKGFLVGIVGESSNGQGLTGIYNSLAFQKLDDGGISFPVQNQEVNADTLCGV